MKAPRTATCGFLAGTTALSLLLASPLNAGNGGGTEVVLNGLVRDFRSWHSDFGAPEPDQGFGHYAGNVSQILGNDGAPLQVHGVTDFDIFAGVLVPGVPYAARLSVLGAEIASGGNPMPVTLQAETDTQVFEPFGSYNDPGGTGDVNDEYNPRHFIFSLDTVYSANTPIAVKATSWMPGPAAEFEFGNHTQYSNSGSDAREDQVATLVTMPEAGYVTKISAYIDATELRYAIYTDNGGEPGDLIIETSKANISSGWNWRSRNITDTWLAAGNYWLAMSLEDVSGNRYKYDTGVSGAATRRTSHNALDNGFDSNWGSSSSSWSNRAVSIYAVYTTGAPTYSEYMTANSGINSQQVKVLKDGDAVPNIPAFQDQASLATFVAPYVNVATGKINIQDNQAIYLFELGTTQINTSAADFQDLVIMITLATDPVYFFSPGTEVEGLNPIGYKVQQQWQDSGGRNIAPHLYTPSLGDDSGMAGAISSGGVTSPGTFYEWFRTMFGANMAGPYDITLTDDGSGVFSYTTQHFRPIDGLLFGNENGSHNRDFTFAVAALFNYDASAGQYFQFEGGDGAWLFINGKLAIDLGGVDSGQAQYASLDRLGLTDGQLCEMRLFYADRGKNNKFDLQTNVFLTPGAVLGTVSGTFD